VEELHPSEDGEALRICANLISPGEQITSSGPIQAPVASQWFAVYTTCRHEKRIAQHFEQRQIEHYLPLYRSERRWRDGSRVTLDLPLFPGYIFVHIQKSDRVSVLSVPGALAVVGGTGREPAAIPESAIEALRAGLAERMVEPHPLLRVGQKARVRSGVFAGMQGVVVRKKNGFRVVLTLEMIMQSVAVEMSEHDLEPICPDGAGDSIIAGVDLGLCLQGA
jgi:transcription antitermination factor NusG